MHVFPLSHSSFICDASGFVVVENGGFASATPRFFALLPSPRLGLWQEGAVETPVSALVPELARVAFRQRTFHRPVPNQA